MKRTTIGRTAFSVAVAFALALGVRDAVAAPGGQSQARRPACEDQADCQATCERLYPGYDGFGICSQGKTCYC